MHGQRGSQASGNPAGLPDKVIGTTESDTINNSAVSSYVGDGAVLKIDDTTSIHAISQSNGVATASGMSAILTTCMGLLQHGDHIVSSRSIFGSTTMLFNKYLSRCAIETSYAGLADLESWERAIRPETRMLFVETPSNPLTEIVDIAIDLEKESILFYLGLKDLVPPEYGRDKLDEIIGQERRHIIQLNGIRKKL